MNNPLHLDRLSDRFTIKEKDIGRLKDRLAVKYHIQAGGKMGFFKNTWKGCWDEEFMITEHLSMIDGKVVPQKRYEKWFDINDDYYNKPMTENNIENYDAKIDLGTICPIDLHVATIYTETLTIYGFKHLLKKGQKLNSSGKYVLYTHGVKQQIEENGVAVYHIGNRICVICHEVNTKANHIFKQVCTEFVKEQHQRLNVLSEMI
jgi:hypothetical protein